MNGLHPCTFQTKIHMIVGDTFQSWRRYKKAPDEKPLTPYQQPQLSAISRVTLIIMG